jgi:hypothetical protein
VLIHKTLTQFEQRLFRDPRTPKAAPRSHQGRPTGRSEHHELMDGAAVPMISNQNGRHKNGGDLAVAAIPGRRLPVSPAGLQRLRGT